MLSIGNMIIEASFSSANEAVIQKLIHRNDRQNEFLFFLKPEVFLTENREYTENIIKMVFDIFQKYAVEVCGSIVLSGERLEETKAMDRHYGYINLMSRNASTSLTGEDKTKIREMLQVGNAIPIYGGHEYLEKYPSLSPRSLDSIWSSKKAEKIRSGLYFQAFNNDSEQYILINGFHPAQLSHFTTQGRRIALILISSNLPWSVLRKRMLGDTFPEKALDGSIRKLLFNSPSEFGQAQVGIANNCAHLSAGPFEAMYELNNFLSDIPAADFDINRTNAANIMKRAGLSEGDIKRAMNNPTSIINGADVTLFDATEELDTNSSIELYRLFYKI